MAKKKLSDIENAIINLEAALQSLKNAYTVAPHSKIYSLIVTIELNIMELNKMQVC